MPADRTPKSTLRSTTVLGHAAQTQHPRKAPTTPLVPKPKGTFNLRNEMGLDMKSYRNLFVCPPSPDLPERCEVGKTHPVPPSQASLRELGEVHLDTDKRWSAQTHNARDAYIREARRSNQIFEKFQDAWPIQHYTANLWLMKKIYRAGKPREDDASHQEGNRDGDEGNEDEGEDGDGGKGYENGNEGGDDEDEEPRDGQGIRHVKLEPDNRKLNPAAKVLSNRNSGAHINSSSQSSISSSAAILPSEGSAPLRQVCGPNRAGPSSSSQSTSHHPSQASSTSDVRDAHLPKFFRSDRGVYEALRKYGLATLAGWELFLQSEKSERDNVLLDLFYTRQVSVIQYNRMVKEVSALCHGST
ncbi:hypothetical protein JAAARDRAFT_45744 [Jaapia argillacea MUCL 33604]|uniref:Uncharacterized protein n=1 Tax=Jaapia argillacea MUCL 33604 TaxID=933084 RepID=A0A067Q2A3_9AGAM|nr:hypothetical protein JAAARDRAFT_45744 [Jaapia argillacea MUCL 33604]